MARINTVNENTTPAASASLLEGVKKQIGMVPNLMATLAHSPASLESFLGFGKTLGKGELGAALHEQIAVTVAGANACGYCASAHTAVGKMHGVESDELARNLEGDSDDPRTGAVLRFARTIVTKRGFVSDEDVAAVRDAGLGEGEIVEVVAAVALNTFTNYFNHVAQTKIDFPEVKVGEPAIA